MEQCNYVDPARAQIGIQYDTDLFSHTIYNNALCIQSDDEKTTINIADLEHVAQLPIYCVFAHGKTISDIDVSFVEDEVNDELHYHITTPPSTFFNLQRHQYVYDTAPLGSLLMCSPHLNDYFGHVIDNPQEFTELLFSTNFKQVSAPIASGDFDLDSPLFSPPQFTTINKTLDFYENVVKSPLRFGIVQLNKPIDEEVTGILKSIGTQLITNTEDEKMARCFNTTISEPGKLTNNPDAEIAFVEHLRSHKFRCTVEELTTTFGPGIYIMSTCSPLILTLKIEDIGNIRYSSESGILSKLKNKTHSQIVDKAVYAFNSDLEAIVYNLNYRWVEMVQAKKTMKLTHNFPHLDVQTSKEYPFVAHVRGGGKKKKNKTISIKKKNSKYQRKRTTIKRRHRQSRARRS
jgi:hypothetical protein